MNVLLWNTTIITIVLLTNNNCCILFRSLTWLNSLICGKSCYFGVWGWTSKYRNLLSPICLKKSIFIWPTVMRYYLYLRYKVLALLCGAIILLLPLFRCYLLGIVAYYTTKYYHNRSAQALRYLGFRFPFHILIKGRTTIMTIIFVSYSDIIHVVKDELLFH